MEYQWDVMPKRKLLLLLLKFSTLLSLLVISMIIGSRMLANLIFDRDIFDFQPLDSKLTFFIYFIIIAIIATMVILSIFCIIVFSDTCTLRFTINDASTTEKIELCDKYNKQVHREFQNAGLYVKHISVERDGEKPYYESIYEVSQRGFRFRIYLHHDLFTIHFGDVNEDDLDFFESKIKGPIERILDDVFSGVELKNIT